MFYRCYLLNSSDHIIGCYNFAAMDDPKAIEVAGQVLDKRPDVCVNCALDYCGVELWEKARQVFRTPTPEG